MLIETIGQSLHALMSDSKVDIRVGGVTPRAFRKQNGLLRSMNPIQSVMSQVIA
jgi:hypothetical protein